MKTARNLIAIGLTIFATDLLADVPGIQNHKVQKLFMEAPCAEVMDVIDGPKAKPDSLQQALQNAGWTAMAFGFLMGFEATHPGIRGDHETILMRLRDDCATNGNRTTIDMLMGYTQK